MNKIIIKSEGQYISDTWVEVYINDTLYIDTTLDMGGVELIKCGELIAMLNDTTIDTTQDTSNIYNRYMVGEDNE